jgi:MFS family permease
LNRRFHTRIPMPDDAEPNTGLSDARKHFRRNYSLHFLEGGLFMGGLAFIAFDSVLPPIIESLGGPNWLISLVPMMMFLGFMWPPLLMAHITERLPRLKWFIMLLGVPQRVVFLFAGLALLFWADKYPVFVLALVALAPLLSGLAGGVSWAAWVELTSRMIPPNRRSSVMAVRAVIGGLIGLLAGQVIRIILERTPGAEGYAQLHFIVFGILVVSLILFAFMKEPRWVSPPDTERTGLLKNLASMPKILRDDRHFRRFVLSQCFGAGFFIMIPFLSIHALNTTGRSEAFLGLLVQAQMAGNIGTNFFAGWMGDRFGGKIVFVCAKVLFVILSVGALVNTAAWGFVALFFLLGCATSFQMVGRSTLSIELCPDRRRPTYLALLQFSIFPAMLLAAVLATVIREIFGVLYPAALLSAVLMTVSLVYLLRIPEPRNK